MTPVRFYSLILEPATKDLSYSDSIEARCLLLAIAGQESAWTDRRQVPGGQARSFWQIQKAGALRAVMTGRFAGMLDTVLLRYSIPTFDEDAVFEAIAWNDTVAYAVARLALLIDPHPLPQIGDEAGSYLTYLRVWRPGKPSRDRWAGIYQQAVKVF